MSLLKEANKPVTLKRQPTEIITDDHIELALSWANNATSLARVGTALKTAPAACYSILARSLAKYVRETK